MLTYKEAAAKLNISVRTLHQIIADGQIRPVRMTSGRSGARRIRPADLDAFIARGGNLPTPAAKNRAQPRPPSD